MGLSVGAVTEVRREDVLLDVALRNKVGGL